MAYDDDQIFVVNLWGYS